MKVNWHDIAAIVTTMFVLGGVFMALMRGFFMSKGACEGNQSKCQKAVCKKIDELKEQVSENKQTVSDHYAEIKGLLGEISGKLDN